jgi:amino acid adenylation domain-containing protein
VSAVAARTETETQVVAFFAEVLGLPPAGIDQHFFEAGGDSITAAQLLARVSTSYGGAPSLVRFFQTPTPRDLAMWLEGFQSATALSPVRQGIPRQPEGAAPQPSPVQEAMWFLDLLEQDRRVLLRPAAWHLLGPLDREALTRALETIVARHEALRQQFYNADGRLEVRIQQNVAMQIALHDLSNLPQEQRSAAAEALSREIALRPFALDREPVFRAALLQLQQDEHWLVFTVHHIVSDGWSGTVLENDLRQAYAHFATGAPLQLPELSVGYRDYCAWLRGRVHSADWNAQLTYWKNELEGAPPYLSLPYDRPHDSLSQTPPDQQNSGGQVRCTLPGALTQRLQSFTTDSRHTLFMVLLATFQALLSRISHARDIVVATPFANRSHPELENLIGLFINLLPLRARLEETSTFNDLLMQARAAGLQAHANQEVPFDTILSAINPAREGARTPFMQVLFQVRNYPRQAADWPALEAESLHVDWRVCGFDLSLEVEEREDQLHLLLSYHHAAFEASTAERILLRYQTLLESALAAPEAPVSALNWLPDEEQNLVLQQWNQTQAPVHDGFIDLLIEEQAARFPDRVAMLEETKSIRYGELNARADRIAAGLRAQGVLPGDLVAIAIERSIDAAVCALAVLKAGGVFLPLEIDHPQPRLQRILDSAKPRLVLCSTRARELQPELAVNWLHAVDCEAAAEGTETIGNRQQRTTTPAESGAYVMYTSGSTGIPKGVLVSHRAAINFMQGFDDLYGFGDKDRQLWKANCSFDLAIQEWLVPLMLGGAVAICPPGRQADIPFLLDFMETHRVTTIDGVPAFHRLLLEAQRDRPRKLSLRYQLVGAAPMSRDLERFLIDHSQWPVHNQYGPTEATVYATVQPCDGETPGSIVPLGRPMRNVRAYVLDEQRNPVGVGVSGEIWLGGEGIALGYWNDPAATAERFFPDPFRPTRECADVPDRRSWTLASRWQAGVSGARRQPGEAAWLSHRVRGYRVHTGITARRAPCGRNPGWF